MKKLFFSFLIAINPTFADTVATATNSAGGMLVITDVPCSNKTGWHAYASSSSNSTMFGCWWSDQTMVHIVWSDNDVWSYPINSWQINYEVAKRLSEKNKGKGI